MNAMLARSTDLLSVNEAPPLPFVRVSSWQDKEVPARRWLVRNRIPSGAVTLLSGDGAAGKTTIALQLAVATVLATDWLGGLVEESGPVFFITAEEDEAEVHRRIEAIAAHLNRRLDELSDLQVLVLPTEDAALGVVSIKGKVVPTLLFDRLANKARKERPSLLIIEAAADVFEINEILRQEVRQSVGLLRKLAAHSGAAVLLISHPSVAGMKDGTGTSGSTHWNNSVRSRMYFYGVKSSDDEVESELRELKVMKSNYGPKGEAVRVKWQQGVFVPTFGNTSFERVAAESAVDATFLRCLDIKTAQGVAVGHKPSRSDAPNTFFRMSEGGRITARAFAKAMERLLASGAIKVQPFGPPSKGTTRLVRTSPAL